MGRKEISHIRREEIVKSFYLVAKQFGLENASIAKVANEMNISKGLVMHYFESKENLLLALNDHILDNYLKFINSSERPSISNRTEFEEFIESLFSRKWNNYIDDGVFYSLYALIYQNKMINEKFRFFLQVLKSELENKLTAAKNDKIILNENISELTTILFALIDGAYYNLGIHLDDNSAYKKNVKPYIKYAMQLIEFA
ncbi:TetR family transcriptional regulator [Flavivirga abyssicola]|uniref:TetR family transcriptional regulator n=1 Tax=Flavivirga abyssicola TaxID=3063533 RepID=UPI0026DF9159|nr:TetR family transcriptional regulator [Flavivirga sp. MEBiC07777]WVK14389.1 TetR family transcriptional regulator [Flavivirga sp. MEBiC07777]